MQVITPDGQQVQGPYHEVNYQLADGSTLLVYAGYDAHVVKGLTDANNRSHLARFT